MKKSKALMIPLLVIIIAIGFCFVLAFNYDKYKLDTKQFETTIELNGEVDLSDLVIYDKITKRKYSVGEFSVVSCDDTTTVGKKVLVIEYKKQKYTINFTVKYKAEFIVDGEVVNTQYVNDASELVLPTPPIKEDYEFIAWDKEIPSKLNNNITFNAIFSSTILAVPLLEDITVDYGTQLQDIQLPSNGNGKWVFVDDLTNFVGNVGQNAFSVKFVPKTSELVEKDDTVLINVRKKKLVFNIQSETFTYDGKAHFPKYSLPVDVKVNVIGSSKIDASNTPYEYALVVNDANYTGSYYGEFVISKADVVITIHNKTIDYAQPCTMDYEIQGFDDESLLGLNIELPSILNAGAYDIGASVANPNINLEVVKGKLIVNKINLDPLPINPTLSTATTPAVYGDKLSSVGIVNDFANGVWSWKAPNAIIDKVSGFKALAVFTPKSSNYNIIEREIEVNNIDKKTLAISVIDNTFVYDNKEHTITYQIEDGSYLDVEVIGNVVKTNAGKYSATRSINHEFYKGSIGTFLVIEKATPITDFSTQYTTTWFAGISLSNINLNNGYVWNAPATSLDDIGTYNFGAKFVPEDTSNYNIVNGEFEVTINKASASITNVKSSYSFVYTGNQHNITGATPSHYETSLQYTYICNNESCASLTNAGDYNVTITLPESKHYNKAEIVTTVSIDKADVEVMLQQLTATYEDTLKDVKLPVENDGVWIWKQDLSTPVGNAGVQKFVAIYTPNNINYNIVELEATIAVAKKQLLFNIIANTYTFDLEAHNIKYTITDLKGKTYTELNVSGNNARINAGVYSITLNIESDNYAGTKTTDLIINKAKPVPNIPTNLTASYLDTLADVQLPVEDNGKWKWNVDTNTLVGDVGKRTFPATFVFDEQDSCDNYEDYVTELSINVCAKPVQVPELATNTATYTGDTITANVPSSNLYKVTQNGAINAGEHNIELTLNDDKNYVWENGDKTTTNIKFYITKAKAIITGLSLQGWTYGGQAGTPSASTNFGKIVYTYTTDEDGLNTIEKPVNAGTYYVKAEVVGNNNYEGDIAILAFVISKKDVDVPAPKAQVYTGDTICASIDDSSLYTVLENNGGINKGTYDVVITINDFVNYKWLNKETQTITITFEIVSAVNNWKVKPQIEGWVYNAAHVGAKAEPYFGTMVITYKQQGEDDSKYTLTEPSNAGSYIAKFYVNGTDDYNYLEVEKTFVISKAEIEIPTIASKPYTGSEQSSGAEGTDLYEVTTDTKGIEAGSYPVVYTITNSNYKWKDIDTVSTTVMFVITKSNAVINSVTMGNWTYGDTASTPSASTNGFGEVIYTYSTSETGQYTQTKPRDAGAYYIKATIPEDSKNYYGASMTKLFNIWQAQAEITGLTMGGWTYGGQASTPSANTNFGEIVYTYTSDEEGLNTIEKPVNAGTYYVKAEVVGNNNYKGDVVILSFVIAQIEIDVPTVTSKPYTASEQSSEAEGTDLYEVTTDTKGTEAGSYPVVYTINNSNYKWKDIDTESTTVMFVITKSSAVINSVTMGDWTFGGTASTPSASTNGFGEVIYTYSTSETGQYTQTKPSDAGTYYIKATIPEDSKNYYGASMTKPFNIWQAQAEITGLTMSGWTYSQTALSPSLIVSDFVAEKDIAYKYSTNNNDWMETKPSDAGTYWVKAFVRTVNNYLGCESSAQSFTILQSSTTINLPTYGTIYMNADDRASYKVTATNVSGGTVEGDWIYGDINYVDGAGASSFSLEFKPKSNNYLSSSTVASITVKSVAVIGSTYYATIEDALAMANSGDTVYVYPDNTGKVVIANPCEIREGATLVLLYGNSTTNGSGRNSTGEEQVHGKDYKNYEKAVLTNLVIVNNDVTITNNGTLEIAGELSGSGGGQPYVGHTARNYAELRLGAGATINSQGTINCTGYINEVVSGKSQINANSGSVYLPFIMRDFKGGTYMKAVYDSMETTKVSPFNQYQFRNISSKLRIKNGATLIGYANIYAGSQPNHANVKFIGATDEYLIKFTDALSYLDAKYNPSNQEYADICKLDFYGGMKLNALLLEISAFGLNVSINTSKVFFPLSWAFDVSLNKAEGQTGEAVYDLQQKLKMMPGSRITIGAGAKAIFSELNIYDNTYQDTNTYPTPLYPTKGSAELIVYGIMEVNTVGGNIHAGGNGAVIDIKSTVGITTQETTLTLIEEGWLIFKTTKAQYKNVSNTSVKLCYNNQASDIQVVATKYIYNNGWAQAS